MAWPYRPCDGLRSQHFRRACRADKTMARGGQSMHNFGLAWDIGIFQGKKYFAEHELYKILGHLPSNNPDLTWGGSSNYAHYQLNTYGDIESVRQEFEA